MLEKRKTVSITPAPKPLLAADLPRTTLSEWLERSVTKKVEKRKRELAEERSQNEVRVSTFCSSSKSFMYRFN
jgi:hypothetical protein